MIEKFYKFKKFLGPETGKYLLVSIITGVLWFLIESSFVFMIQGFLLSIGLLNKSQVFLPEWYPVDIISSVLLLILFGFMRAIASMVKTHVGSLTQISFASYQRKKILSLGLKNARIVSSKEVITLFSEVVGQASNVLANLSQAINLACAVVLFFISGLKLAPYEMLSGVFLLACFLFPLKYCTRKVNSYGVGLLQEWENLSESFLRGLRNFFFLSIYKRLDAEINHGKENIENYEVHFKSYSVVASFVGAFPLFIGIIVLSVITYSSVQFFKTDPMKLISFFYLFIRLAQSAGEGSGILTNLKLNMPGLRKLYNWIESHNKISAIIPRKEVVITDSQIKIEVEDLSFGYDSTNFLLSNLSFKLERKDVLVIKGHSGAGKSTLLNLVLGMNLPTSGEVKINGHSSQHVNVDLHKVLAYVGPEPFLIQGTVRDNLYYGLEKDHGITDEELWSALDIVGLRELIFGLSLQLDEPINEIPQISTGQKQRLSFARAMVRKPSLLILDEATANLDVSTEKKIIFNIQNLLENCTTIIVTHKDSFDKIATQSIVLKAN